MVRTFSGVAALALTAVLAACGDAPTAAPTPGPPDTGPAAEATVAPTPTEAAPSPGTATASPDGTATATPPGTATPDATPTGELTLPERVASFQRVEQRSEGDRRIGAYYSESLSTAIEVYLVRNQPERTLLTSLGGSDPTMVGPALCSSAGDTLCAQARDGVTVAVASKELPSTMVGGLTTQFLDAD